MTFLLIKTRTARKQHRCDWCPEAILPSAQYVDERAIYEGDFQALKFHPECKIACNEVAKEEGEFDISLRGYKRGCVKER